MPTSSSIEVCIPARPRLAVPSFGRVIRRSRSVFHAGPVCSLGECSRYHLVLQKIEATVAALIRAPARRRKLTYQAVRTFSELSSVAQHPRIVSLVDYFLRTVRQWIDGRKRGATAHALQVDLYEAERDRILRIVTAGHNLSQEKHIKFQHKLSVLGIFVTELAKLTASDDYQATLSAHEEQQPKSSGAAEGTGDPNSIHQAEYSEGKSDAHVAGDAHEPQDAADWNVSDADRAAHGQLPPAVNPHRFTPMLFAFVVCCFGLALSRVKSHFATPTTPKAGHKKLAKVKGKAKSSKKGKGAAAAWRPRQSSEERIFTSEQPVAAASGAKPTCKPCVKAHPTTRSNGVTDQVSGSKKTGSAQYGRTSGTLPRPASNLNLEPTVVAQVCCKPRSRAASLERCVVKPVPPVHSPLLPKSSSVPETRPTCPSASSPSPKSANGSARTRHPAPFRERTPSSSCSRSESRSRSTSAVTVARKSKIPRLQSKGLQTTESCHVLDAPSKASVGKASKADRSWLDVLTSAERVGDTSDVPQETASTPINHEQTDLVASEGTALTVTSPESTNGPALLSPNPASGRTTGHKKFSYRAALVGVAETNSNSDHTSEEGSTSSELSRDGQRRASTDSESSSNCSTAAISLRSVDCSEEEDGPAIYESRATVNPKKNNNRKKKRARKRNKRPNRSAATAHLQQQHLQLAAAAAFHQQQLMMLYHTPPVNIPVSASVHPPLGSQTIGGAQPSPLPQPMVVQMDSPNQVDHHEQHAPGAPPQQLESAMLQPPYASLGIVSDAAQNTGPHAQLFQQTLPPAGMSISALSPPDHYALYMHHQQQHHNAVLAMMHTAAQLQHKSMAPSPSQKPTRGPSPSKLKRKLRKQLEFYFSDKNLVGDFFLKSLMDDQGAVSLTDIARFPRVHHLLGVASASLGSDHSVSILQNAVKSSRMLQLFSCDQRLGRRPPHPKSDFCNPHAASNECHFAKALVGADENEHKGEP